jgi:hypothetical protein
VSRPAPALSVFLLAALCVFVFCAPEDSISDEAIGAPNMVLKQQIHDFKNVLEGEVLEHTFEVLNQGDEPLSIERVEPDCSCSVVDFDPLIPPNGEGKIKLKINTKGFEGPERWVVKVFSNDPRWRVAVLDLRANVKTVITLAGSPVFFTGKKNAPITEEVEISTATDKPLILTPERFTLSDKVTYSLSEIEKEKRYKVTFQHVAAKRENYRGFLKLKTNFAEKPDVTIWIIGRFDN